MDSENFTRSFIVFYQNISLSLSQTQYLLFVEFMKKKVQRKFAKLLKKITIFCLFY